MDMQHWLDQRDFVRMAHLNATLDVTTIADPGSDTRNVEGTVHCVEVENGAFFVSNQWRALRRFEHGTIIHNSLGIHIVQSGDLSQAFPNEKRYHHSGARVVLTAYPGEVRQWRAYEPGVVMKSIAGWVDPDLLVDKFGLQTDHLPEPLRQFFNGACDRPFCVSLPLSPALWMVVDDVIACQFEGALRDVYLRSKLTELICIVVATINRLGRPAADGERFSPASREQVAVDTAALIYMNELRHPPTLNAISMRVGVNRNKLRAGFLKTFGSTPHEYSLRHRMDWAKKLLSEQHLSVQAVATAAGYTTMSAFSRAFSSYFGFPPSKIDN
jgi:AraC family transcriptional activator of pyochelin receptor